MKQIAILILIFMIYSILGWCLEVICKLIENQKFINRGFLIGPYCPIYGYGVLFMTIISKKYLNDPLTLFIMIILTCSTLEYITSFTLEKIFSTRWWDYSRRKFNINGRICLETMIPFGVIGMIILYILNPIIFNFLEKIHPSILITTSTIFLIIFTIDCYLSFKIISNIQKLNKETQQKQIIKKDDTEKITKLVKKEITNSKKIFEKRIINAFPHLQMKKINKKK